MTNKFDCHIRNEFFGYLIWSNNLSTYLIPSSEESTSLTKLLIEDGVDAVINDKKFCKEARKIGLDGDIRILDHAIKNQLSAPLDIYFDFTWICNLISVCSQSYCYAREDLGNTSMSCEKIEEVFYKIYDSGVMRTHLAGGEPTANFDGLYSYLKMAESLGICTSITTNGTLLSKKVRALLIDSSLYSITVSLDGYNNILNDRIRGNKVFDKVTHGLKKLISERNSSNSKIKICLKPIFTPNTKLEFFECFVKLCLELGVDELKLNNPERCGFHERGYYGKSVNEYYKVLENIEKIKEKYSDKLDIKTTANPLSNCQDIGLPGFKGCVGGQELASVGADGRLRPCAIHNYDLGNIFEFKNFQEAWTKNIRRDIFKSKMKLPEKCNNCEIFSKCRGGSQIRKVVEYGFFEDKADPLCTKDYLNSVNKKFIDKNSHQNFDYFKSINVAHSL